MQPAERDPSPAGQGLPPAAGRAGRGGGFEIMNSQLWGGSLGLNILFVITGEFDDYLDHCRFACVQN